MNECAGMENDGKRPMYAYRTDIDLPAVLDAVYSYCRSLDYSPCYKCVLNSFDNECHLGEPYKWRKDSMERITEEKK